MKNIARRTPSPLVTKPLTRAQIAKLDPVSLLLETARANLLQYGQVVPPQEALFATMVQTCPHCNTPGTVAKMFGTRRVRGEVRPQSWCRSCRNSRDSHPTRFGL